jgi:hypothetical protein
MEPDTRAQVGCCQGIIDELIAICGADRGVNQLGQGICHKTAALGPESDSRNDSSASAVSTAAVNRFAPLDHVSNVTVMSKRKQEMVERRWNKTRSRTGKAWRRRERQTEHTHDWPESVRG